MFQINSLFLHKFGWKSNVWDKNIPYTFVSDRTYGILYEDDKTYFIKSFENVEDRSYSGSYFYYTNILRNNIEEKIEIKSNAEMIKEIKKNDACTKEYQRHFKLSSILNNK